MSDVNGADGTPNQADGKGSENQTPTDGQVQTVKFETYDKAMSSLSRAKSELEQIREENARLKNSELEASGKKDELIDNLRSQNAELSGKLKKAVGSFARSKALDSIVDEAIKQGCNSVTLLKKAVEGELDTLEFDDSFNPNKDQVKAMLDKVREEAPILFGKAAPKTADHNLNPDAVGTGSVKKLSEMTDDELKSALAKHF